MSNQLNNHLIALMKQHVSQGENLAAILIDLLCLGKEAIYRRLRSEVPFTFEEAMKIARKFEISLDQLSIIKDCSHHVKWATFDVDKLYSSHNYVESHCEKIKSFSMELQHMRCSQKAMLRSANCFLPYTFIVPFEKLSQLRHYKWIYLAQEKNPNFALSDLAMPSHVLELEKEFAREIRFIPRTLFILDRNVFYSIINDIDYFFKRQLISEKELHELKDELFALVALVEKLTATGSYDTGAEVNIFLSQVDLGSCNTHLECDSREICINWTYFVDVISFYNRKMCQKQKEWIELLKRYSIQITQSGEMERVCFFNKQRKAIEELCSNTL